MNVPDSDSEDELPPGWEERVTMDGSVFYANHLTKLTQWTHPRTGKKKLVSGELPYGWERCVDKNTGKVIYVDHDNKRTTYTDPRLAFAVEEKDHANDYRQRFDASSTALQVLHGRDLTNKVALITGANSGIGFETARALAKHGCTVIFACRNMLSAQECVYKIVAEKGSARCEIVHLDLKSLESVKECVKDVKNNFKKIDMVILNAGVCGIPYSKTGDGFETTFQVNYLGHFYLALLLRPLVPVGGRFVMVSSESHRFADLTTETISPGTLSVESKNYWGMLVYNNSKLCNVLFARLFAKKLQDSGISVFSLHPGNMVYSKLCNSWWFYKLIFYISRPFTKSLLQAASTSVFCATAQELNGTTGVYFNNCYRCQESSAAQDDELAENLWDISCDMVRQVLGPDAEALSTPESPL